MAASYNEIFGVGTHAGDIRAGVLCKMDSSLANFRGGNDAIASGSYSAGVLGDALSMTASSTGRLFLNCPTNFEVPGGFTNTGLTYDSVNGTLWIGDFTNSQLVECTLEGVATGDTISLGFQPQGVAFDSSDETFWVANNAAGQLAHIDRAGATVSGPIGLGFTPNGVCYVASSDEVWYVRNGGNVVAKHSAATGSLLGTVTISGATSLDGLEYDAANSHILTTDDTQNVFRRSDTSGTLVRSFLAPAWVEDIAVTPNGVLFCCDAEFHGGTANGNRIHAEPESAIGYAYTIGCWLKSSNPSGAKAVIVVGDPVSGNGVGLYINGTGTVRIFCRDGTTQVFNDTSVAYSTFKHLALVFDPVEDEARLYVDASLAKTVSLSTIDFDKLRNGPNWYFGTDNATRNLVAELDEVFVFEKAVSAADIAEIYNGAEPLNSVAPTLTFGVSTWTGTVGTWSEEDNGTVTYAWELRLASDDSVVQSGTGASPSGSNPAAGSYYLWVRGTNDGGFDSGEDSVSTTQVLGGGGGSIIPLIQYHRQLMAA